MKGSIHAQAGISILLVCALGIGIGYFLGTRHGDQPASSIQEKRGGETGPSVPEEGVIALSAEQKQTFQLKIEPAEAKISAETILATGKVAANPERTAVIAPRTAGRITRVSAHLGDTVQRGERLAFLDSVEAAEVMAEWGQSESGLTLAQARAEREKELYAAKLQVLETVKRGEGAAAAAAALSRVELGRLKQDYLAALARLELAQSIHDRQKLLVEKKIGARKDLVEAEKTLLTARGEVESVAETIRLTARQDLLAAGTALEQARQQRDKGKEKLRLLGLSEPPPSLGQNPPPAGRTLVPLTAPFAGTIIDRQVTEGQLIEPGFAAFRLADLSTLWVMLDIPETQAARVRVSQPVSLESAGGKTQQGRVSFVGDLVEEQTRTVKVRVELSNPDRHFKPGMFVSARITLNHSGPPMILVPPSAVFLLEDRQVVFVDEGERIRTRLVETGPPAASGVPVLKGLNPGEKIVVEGGFALKAHLLKSRMGED